MMHPHEFIVATNQKLDLRDPRPSRDQRLQDRPRRAWLSSRPPADHGAFMEPRGCNGWQSPAKRKGRKPQNKPKPLRPVATGCLERAVGMEPFMELSRSRGRTKANSQPWPAVLSRGRS